MKEELNELSELTPIEILNYFRNRYYNDGNSTENGIVANALNDIMPRMIVPPVKVGQTVWYIEGGYYNAAVKRAREKEVTEINIKRQNGRTEWGFIADGTRYRFTSIGKTVFLTREAAEAALKARENK